MGESKLKADEIQFKYLFDDNYNPIYINGAQGGVNIKGEIIANFYFERSAIPYSSTHQITAENQILQSGIEQKPEDVDRKLIRMVKSGVIMNYQTATELRDWLSKQIETFEKLTKHTKHK